MFVTNKAFADTEEVTIEENLGLVRLCAGRFKGKGIEYEELYSAGCIGLIKAAKAFDKSRGVRVSTYAVPVILGEIKRLFRDGGMIKVSRSIKERSLMISRLTEKFEHENGREPTVDELCRLTGLDACDVTEAICVAQPTVSLTSSGDDDKDSQIDIPVPPPDNDIINSLALRQALETLDERDKSLIYCRFFMNLTQETTAKRLGMSQVQVSSREKKLLAYLRQKL